ncbi:MAG: hypothetical protein IPL73_08980 [Candidatus Obscuribacter sp.]|nr:hypothetical protein [Candidatus Obscuribacter sp.]
MTQATQTDNNNQSIYVEDKPVETVKVFAVAKDDGKYAAQIANMYVSALGAGGVSAPGHEAYPDSDLFTLEGVEATISAGERTIAIACPVDASGEQQPCAGAMVMDRLSPYHVEFNSMAVAMPSRGLKLSSKIVQDLRDLVDLSDFTVNATELVTHSLASQAAHIRAGYKNICGFGFCQYPRVFFKDHPESVLWVVRLQGKLVSRVKQLRANLGRGLGDSIDLVQHKVVEAQARFSASSTYQRLDEKQLTIVSDLLSSRVSYVPQRYKALVESILFQFEDTLDRTVRSESDLTTQPGPAQDSKTSAESDFDVELKEGFGHSYIIYKQNFVFDSASIDKTISDLKAKDKRFILVRIPAHNGEALPLAQHLQKAGFVFHSYLPLYGYYEGSSALFGDILTLQWLKPEVVAQNALPGQTESVIKLYGYPENLSGPIIETIACELKAIDIGTNCGGGAK